MEIKTPTPPPPPAPPAALRALLCFSAWTNGQKLFNTRQPAGTLTCLNGIRVISISWVILGHCLVVMQRVTENVLQTGKIHLNRWTFMAIYNATFSVDSFFLMSGLLITYLTLNELRRHQGRVSWPMFYFHRYVRLTPIYLVLLGLWAGAMPYAAEGPFYGPIEKNYCEKSWWANALYIQNLIKWGDDATAKGCFAWAWYLAVDMQFYVLSPLLLLPLYHRPRLGALVWAAFFTAATVTPFTLAWTRHYGWFGAPPEGYAHEPQGDSDYDLYIAPYSRMGAWLVGVACGWQLHAHRRRRLPTAVNLAGWAVALAIGLAVVYGVFDYAGVDPGSARMPLGLAAAYNALARPAWAVAVAWVVLSCSWGSGGPVNWLLSWRLWVPGARLTYAVYLLHPAVLSYYGLTRPTPFYMDDIALTALYLAALSATFLLAVPATLVLEAPVVALEKLLLGKDKRS